MTFTIQDFADFAEERSSSAWTPERGFGKMKLRNKIMLGSVAALVGVMVVVAVAPAPEETAPPAQYVHPLARISN